MLANHLIPAGLAVHEAQGELQVGCGLPKECDLELNIKYCAFPDSFNYCSSAYVRLLNIVLLVSDFLISGAVLHFFHDCTQRNHSLSSKREREGRLAFPNQQDCALRP